MGDGVTRARARGFNNYWRSIRNNALDTQCMCIKYYHHLLFIIVFANQFQQSRIVCVGRVYFVTRICLAQYYLREKTRPVHGGY